MTIILLVVALACSCSSVEPLKGNAITIPGVPFYPQEDHQCGPSSLATVMNFWQVRQNKGLIPIEEITKAIYSPGARGALPADLENYPVKRGFKTHQYTGSVADVRKHVDDGVPIVILVDQGLSVYQINHFMVAVGYTDTGIIFHNGRKQNAVVTNSRLEKIWKKTGYWTLRVVPSS